ncbi:cupin domain-containing protein [Sesbania bispinosa]|nr:cupin domain-containing protein [Sesbania bispinosa]
MAKELNVATIDSAKYSQEFLAWRRADPIPPTASASRMPPRKVRGTGNVLPPHRRKVAKESILMLHGYAISSVIMTFTRPLILVLHFLNP